MGDCDVVRLSAEDRLDIGERFGDRDCDSLIFVLVPRLCDDNVIRRGDIHSGVHGDDSSVSGRLGRREVITGDDKTVESVNTSGRDDAETGGSGDFEKPISLDARRRGESSQRTLLIHNDQAGKIGDTCRRGSVCDSSVRCLSQRGSSGDDNSHCGGCLREARDCDGLCTCDEDYCSVDGRASKCGSRRHGMDIETANSDSGNNGLCVTGNNSRSAEDSSCDSVTHTQVLSEDEGNGQERVEANRAHQYCLAYCCFVCFPWLRVLICRKRTLCLGDALSYSGNLI